jgi:hypothetical protein
MKLNLIYGRGQKLDGYTNINAVPVEDDDVITADPSNLDFFVDDAEAEDIIACDVVNFLPKSIMVSTINHWVGKLRHGGSIAIGGIDCYAIARDIVNKKIDLQSMNDILYGAGVSGWDIRKNAFTMESLVDHLRDLGLKIQRSRIDKYEIIVEAVRP